MMMIEEDISGLTEEEFKKTEIYKILMQAAEEKFRKKLRRIYSVKNVDDKTIYVNQTSDCSKRLSKNSDIHLTELLSYSKAKEEVEKIKKKYRDDGWIIIENYV